MERVAICGVMASGKTHIAEMLVKEQGFTKFSLATGVKDLARDVFLMKDKDRKLLQQIGMYMRKIQPKVWINLLMRRVAEYSNDLKAAGNGWELKIVVDDCRFMNEVIAFKDAGYTLIRIHIDEALQIKRLKKTYGAKADEHINNRKDDSEAEMRMIRDEYFDLVVYAADDDSVTKQVNRYLSKPNA
jgi:dephospho-CoA kinase